jgi:hypothetical protein
MGDHPMTRDQLIQALVSTGLSREDAEREVGEAMENPSGFAPKVAKRVRKDADGQPIVERVDGGRTRRMG